LSVCVREPPAGIDGSSGTAGGSIHVALLDVMGASYLADFPGAPNGRSTGGVLCRLSPDSTGLPQLLVGGGDADVTNEASLSLSNFMLTAGESRMESFSADQPTATIVVNLVGSSWEFTYLQATDPTSGSCTTTISALTSTSVAGTLDCNPPPPHAPGGTADLQSLSIAFACSLQP
jgi:hypothetical protein